MRLLLLALIILAGCVSASTAEDREAYFRQQILILQAERDAAVKIAAHEMATREARCLNYKPL